jgi:hypothetical protein
MKTVLKGHSFQSAEDVKEVTVTAFKKVTGKGL